MRGCERDPSKCGGTKPVLLQRCTYLFALYLYEPVWSCDQSVPAFLAMLPVVLLRHNSGGCVRSYGSLGRTSSPATMTFSPGKKLPHSIFLAKLHGKGAGFGVEAPTLCAGCGRSAADRGIGFLRSFVPFLSQLLYQCRLGSQAPDALMRVEKFAVLSCVHFEPISHERNLTEMMHGASSPLAPRHLAWCLVQTVCKLRSNFWTK